MRRSSISLVCAGLVVWFSSGCTSRYINQIDEEFRVDEWIPQVETPTRETGDAPSAVPEPKAALAVYRRVHAIDLAWVLNRAGAESLEIKMARERARMAAADESIAASRFLPEIVPGTSAWFHRGRVQATAGAFLNTRKQNTTLGIVADWIIDLGANYYEMLAAERRTEARIYEIQEKGHQVLLRAAWLYYDLVEKKGLERISEEALKFARELLRYESQRARLGASLESDKLRAQARVATTERDLAASRENVALAKASLKELLLLGPDEELVLSEDRIVPIRFIEDSVTLESLVDKAFAARPDLRSLRAEYQAAHEMVSARDDGWMIPRLRATTSHGFFDHGYGSLHDQSSYRFGIEWHLNLGMVGESQKARAARRELEYRDAELRQRVVMQIQRERERVKAAKEQIAAARREIEAAKKFREVAEAQSKLGRGLFIDVLDAQVAEARAQAALVAAISQHNRGQYALLWSIGGPGA